MTDPSDPSTLQLLQRYDCSQHLDQAIQAFAEAEASNPDPIQTVLVEPECSPKDPEHPTILAND